jgi:hypothetical protein
MIHQLTFCTLYLQSNVGSNLPFVGDTQQSYTHVCEGIFKDPSLMDIFTLPPLSPTTTIYLVNMIYSFTNGSLDSSDP